MIKKNNMIFKDIYAIYIKALVALIAPLVLYWQDLSVIMKDALKSDLTTYIVIIPFMILYLIIRLRKTLLASISSQYDNKIFRKSYPLKEIVGISLCILAYSIKGFGHYTFYPIEYHIASLPIFISGIILIVFNEVTLSILIFPIAYLLLLIPPPIEFAMFIGSFLADVSSKISYSILSFIGLQVDLVTLYGNPIIYLTTLQGIEIPFTIDLACSGIYSLMGFIIFSIFIAYISKGRYLRKTSVFILGLIIMILLNILRISSIIIVGYRFGFNIALNIFHLFGGWILTFLGTIILLIMSEKVFKISIFNKNKVSCSSCNNIKTNYCNECGEILKINPTSLSSNDVIKLFFVVIILISFLFVQVPAFVLTKGEIETLSPGPTEVETYTSLLPRINRYELSFYFRDLEFENISGQDRSLLYRYVRENGQYDQNDPLRRTTWVGLEIGPTKASLHDWVVCLITWRQKVGLDVTVNPVDLKEIQLVSNPPLSARYFAFQEMDSNVTQVILYWYFKMNFKINDLYQEKWSKISIISYTQNIDSIEDVEDEMLMVAREISKYLEPIEEWTQFSISIGENVKSLIILSALPVFGVVPYTIFFERKKKSNAKLMLNYVNDADDIIFLQIIKPKNNLVINKLDLVSEYNKISNKDIDIDILNMKIDQAKKLGLIETQIRKINDVPYLSWKILY